MEKVLKDETLKDETLKDEVSAAEETLKAETLKGRVSAAEKDLKENFAGERLAPQGKIAGFSYLTGFCGCLRCLWAR